MNRCPFTGMPICFYEEAMCPDWDDCTIREREDEEEDDEEEDNG